MGKKGKFSPGRQGKHAGLVNPHSPEASMVRAHEYYQSLTERYCEHLHLNHAWPANDLVEEWFKTACGLKGGIYTAMRDGRPVPAKYTIWFVRLIAGSDERVASLLTSPKRKSNWEHARAHTKDFVKQFGIHELGADTAEAMRQHICYPPFHASAGLKKVVDWLRFKASCLSDILSKDGHAHWVHGTSAQQVPGIVEWLYWRVAEETAAAGRLLSPGAKRAFAEERMGITLDNYVPLVRAWNDFNPWIVTRAWDERKGAVGMSITLPVTTAAYEAVRAGKLTPYKLTPGDFTRPPSLDFVLEAMVENPRYVGHFTPNPFAVLRISSIYQLGALARTNLYPGPGVLRLLSFAGTPQNEDRLQTAGFVPTGATMRHPNPSTKLKVYELTMKVNQLSTDVIESGTLKQVGETLPEVPTMDEG